LAARSSERSFAFDSALIVQAKALKDVPTDLEGAITIELNLHVSSMQAPSDPALRADLAQRAKYRPAMWLVVDDPNVIGSSEPESCLPEDRLC